MVVCRALGEESLNELLTYNEMPHRNDVKIIPSAPMENVLKKLVESRPFYDK